MINLYAKYIFKKCLITTSAMFAIFTGIVWAVEILNISRGGILLVHLGLIDFLHLCSFILPYDMTLIWPIAVFFGILITIHQMQHKNEFLSFRYLGLSHYQILKPIILFVTLLTLLCLVTTYQIAPILYKKLRIKQSEAEERAILSMLHKQKFNNFNGNIIYFDNIDEEGAATNVTIWFADKNEKESSVIVSEKLKFVKRHDGLSVVMLVNTKNYKVNTNPNEKSAILSSKASFITLSSIISPEKINVINKAFYITGIKKLYELGIKGKNLDSWNEMHSRLLRPLYPIIITLFIYGMLAGRTNFRNNELQYFVKYILSFIFLTVLGFENNKIFIETKYWPLSYFIALLILLFALCKIIKLNNRL